MGGGLLATLTQLVRLIKRVQVRAQTQKPLTPFSLKSNCTVQKQETKNVIAQPNKLQK